MATTNKADLSRISIVPGQRSGQPCIRGLRVTVWDVLDMLASGMTEDEIPTDYPYLEKADFKAVYAYASHFGRDPISRVWRDSRRMPLYGSMPLGTVSRS